MGKAVEARQEFAEATALVLKIKGEVDNPDDPIGGAAMPPTEKRKRIELTEVERLALITRVKHLSRTAGMNIAQVSIATGISEHAVRSILKWGSCERSVVARENN
jgi:hypothetical protein